MLTGCIEISMLRLQAGKLCHDHSTVILCRHEVEAKKTRFYSNWPDVSTAPGVRRFLCAMSVSEVAVLQVSLALGKFRMSHLFAKGTMRNTSIR